MSQFGHVVFNMRRYASTVYAIIMCLSVYLSQVTVLPRWLNLGSFKQRPGTLVFLMPKISAKFPMGRQSNCGVGYNWQFLTNILLYLRNGAR